MSERPARQRGECGVEVRVHSVPPQGYLGVLFCGRVHGWRVHSIGRKKPPRLCLGRDCPHCKPVDPPPRWYGYAAAEITSGATEEWTPGIIEVTEQCYHCVAGVDLPGTLWWLWRQQAAHGRKEVVAERAEHPGSDRYTRAISVPLAVARLYRLDELPNEADPPIRRYQEIERCTHADLPARRPQDRLSLSPSIAAEEAQKLAELSRIGRKKMGLAPRPEGGGQ